MTDESPKLKQKVPRSRKSRSAARKRLSATSPQKSVWGSRLSSTLAWMLLFSGAGLIITCGWISILFIFDPKQVIWLNDFLPTGAKINVSVTEIPKTLTEIQNILQKQKLTTGEVLSLEPGDSRNNKLSDKLPNLFLLPVFREVNNCKNNCKKLVELRIYQKSQEVEFKLQKEPHYYQVQKLDINGVNKLFVETPVGKNISINESQNQEVYLPLTEIKAFNDGKSLPGFWFYLKGEHKKDTQDNQDSLSITYGQIVHYNPLLRSLEKMLSWKTPHGKLPKWEQVTGSKTEELVIDQTVALEPRLQVYQIKSGELVSNSVLLEAIDLKPAMKGYGYEQSLLLARNGLWTPADSWLTSLQKEMKKPLSEYVQAQIDLIKLHSQLTKTQADKTWVSPGQTVLTSLIDGRWEQGLDVLISSPDSGRDIFNLLKADRGRLWNRTTVALRLSPQRKAVLAWAYLMLTVQRGEERANTWLESQPDINKETFTYLQELLVKLNQEVQNTHPSQIIGKVKKVTDVQYTDWLPVDGKTDFSEIDNQVLYEVNTSAFQDGKSWLIYPFTDLKLPKIQTSLFWIKTLGLASDGSMQIAVWLPNGEQQVTTATIKAVQLRNGELKLLVAGDRIEENQDGDLPHPPLAFTTAALEWVQPSPISIEALAMVNPDAVQVALPKIWNSLQQSGDIDQGQSSTLEKMFAKVKNWPVQMIDMTGDGNSDLVFTISQEAIASLTNSVQIVNTAKTKKPPRTIIISGTGEVIYNDFNRDTQQALTAIAKLNSDQSIALLVENKDRYSIRRWSKTNQRLE
ncbi:MAG: hypothetical protein EAZ76_00300 [Nostocales cyanobacterium]|nr:MAG: hypothetical protein EAZ87_22115 [Nostocales cyanobacterium]TAF21628.1 MAG: hypothetical protein EAZ76_00300 [Nostocales cyanobacterium]